MTIVTEKCFYDDYNGKNIMRTIITGRHYNDDYDWKTVLRKLYYKRNILLR